MGDYPTRQAWASLELTDQIFAGALQEAALQDEVYCQILKQLTHNTRRCAGSVLTARLCPLREGGSHTPRQALRAATAAGTRPACGLPGAVTFGRPWPLTTRRASSSSAGRGGGLGGGAGAGRPAPQSSGLFCRRHSEERGWQLLWLCTGLFPPGKALLPHVHKFLDARRARPLAPDCSRRVQRALRTGPRKQPPHQVEVEAAEQNISRICHKVFLPNNTTQMLEVSAHTRVRDVCADVAARLQLASWEGCSLFIKIADKVISQKEGDFFFDSLRQVADWVKRSKPQKEGGPRGRAGQAGVRAGAGREAQAGSGSSWRAAGRVAAQAGRLCSLRPPGAPLTLPYQVYFMRKLWLGVAPGKDVRADTVLHYHQELPKYLRGFHKCPREDAVQLASLIYKAQFGGDQAQLASIPKVLGELVPENLTRLMSPEEWRKVPPGLGWWAGSECTRPAPTPGLSPPAWPHRPSPQSILLACEQHRDKTPEEAKVAFLRGISRWPTFGSAFFEVKVVSPARALCLHAVPPPSRQPELPDRSWPKLGPAGGRCGAQSALRL
uniref:Myosin VIIB n=1 Tax=Pipistrellus kuhlii TaxID=59472 RepID=A0A7J7QT18_PIPKU|nr:myosin VIIB [Pipistrellus kuhlii]